MLVSGTTWHNPEITVEVKPKLEEIMKMMLLIWCQNDKAVNITSKCNDCDKIVVVHRESGEFGFRIHGSKPVVVSAIEPGTPAESSGLEVGDIVLMVNGVSVLDKNHSEIVKIAHAGSDTLEMEVARTCYALEDPPTESDCAKTLHSGYMWKMNGFASGKMTDKWIRRWFCLKDNSCLYCYKTETDKHPVDVVMLVDQQTRVLTDEDNVSKWNGFSIQRPDGFPLYLAADSSEARDLWIGLIDRALSHKEVEDRFLETSKRNLTLAPSCVADPDCFGYLGKFGTQWKSWSKRYCVLKDACLYFYQDANAKRAFGAAYLHGYKVQHYLSGVKKHAFEIVPTDPAKKHFYFHTDSEADKKMWIAAMEYSIDKWLKI
ncbi:unnamed protein product [Phaedon cochleariae]|uniref:Uncharacterized protein n=1 Tax=Phaedon cochleariae TaxID=80249 RepID=A0A9P0DQ54_PHACE|nr:unnamed protein product [Phaedon cochleariae]